MTAMIAEKAGAEFEASFLAMMVHHHKGGLPSWQLAKEKSKNEIILELEKKTVPKERKEIEQMTAWLKQWHNKSPDDFKEPEESRKMMEQDMAALQAAGGMGFDPLFAKQMAHHHKMAIEMAEIAAQKAEHAEVKEFARHLAETQTQDKEKLEAITGHGKH